MNEALLVARRWVLKAAVDTASCLMYLHDNGIAHGDVYAHNMMAGDDGTTTLCDYGASFFYPARHRTVWERMEVRVPRACAH